MFHFFQKFLLVVTVGPKVLKLTTWKVPMSQRGMRLQIVVGTQKQIGTAKPQTKEGLMVLKVRVIRKASLLIQKNSTSL